MGSLLSRLAFGQIPRTSLVLTYTVGIAIGGVAAAAILALMGA
jgi:hypothetical protein